MKATGVRWNHMLCFHLALPFSLSLFHSEQLILQHMLVMLGYLYPLRICVYRVGVEVRYVANWMGTDWILHVSGEEGSKESLQGRCIKAYLNVLWKYVEFTILGSIDLQLWRSSALTGHWARILFLLQDHAISSCEGVRAIGGRGAKKSLHISSEACWWKKVQALPPCESWGMLGK